MGARTVRTIAADQLVLDAIAETPRTAREIAEVLRAEVLETWADEHGYDIEWGGREPLGARLLAISSAEERGLVHLMAYQVYARLRTLERRGLIRRITPPGGRGILWLAANESGGAA